MELKANIYIYIWISGISWYIYNQEYDNWVYLNVEYKPELAIKMMKLVKIHSNWGVFYFQINPQKKVVMFAAECKFVQLSDLDTSKLLIWKGKCHKCLTFLTVIAQTWIYGAGCLYETRIKHRNNIWLTLKSRRSATICRLVWVPKCVWFSPSPQKMDWVWMPTVQHKVSAGIVPQDFRSNTGILCVLAAPKCALIP